MKKVVFVALAIAVLIVAWQNKRGLFRIYLLMRNPPARLEFTQYTKDRLHISYVPGPYLTAHVSAIADRVLKNLAQAEKQTGAQLDALNLRLYNNYEEKGADIEDITIAHADPENNTVYCIVNNEMDGTVERLEYELLLVKCCGRPIAADGGRIAAAALGGVWNQRTLDEWNAFLTQRKFTSNDANTESASQFIRIPLNAIASRLLLDRHGWKAFIGYYKNNSLPAEFTPAAGVMKDPAAASLTRSFKAEFQKGMSYAYDNGYTSGYATRQSEKSLDLLKKNGVDWIASIPYGYMRSRDSTTIHSAGHSIFGESDESMFALAAMARARGIKIMLKPQIWSHQGWTGMIDFQDDASWDQWFRSYQNWIVHYAIIAELTDAKLFCIGTELVKTTLKRPDSWRKIIARVREIYHGDIVYAANYGDEFEKLQFWDALDYIGLDNYYGIRTTTLDGENVMRQNFANQKERIHAIALRWNKPVIFTEIGYQANPGAGMGSNENSVSGYDENMQALCYRLAMETYWKEPWFKGMYWWKWFSNPNDSGKTADTHSPHGRLAEKVLAEWYR